MQAPRTLDFTDHRRILWGNTCIYPVVSRRSRGLSIGVNLNVDKVCNFDCPYCQVDRSQPSKQQQVELATLERELDALLGMAASGEIWRHAPFDTVAPHLRRVNDVAFAGDGEPTSSKNLLASLALTGRLLREHGLGDVRPVILSNATLLHRPQVQRALELLDSLGGQLWAKLDAGTEPYFQFVNGTTLSFDRVLQNLLQAARVRPIVLQSMFLRLHELGPSQAEIAAYLGRIEHILKSGGRIELVQVYSVARHPTRPVLHMLPTGALEQIAQGVRSLGVVAQVYAGRPA